MFGILILTTALLSVLSVSFGSNDTANTTSASYYLVDNFSGTTFFDNFEFQTFDDPTHGTNGSFSTNG